MRRRLFWVGVGYCAGLGSVMWVRRQIRRVPLHLRTAVAERSHQLGDRSRQMGERARRVATDLHEAMVDGHAAMRDTENELRTELGL